MQIRISASNANVNSVVRDKMNRYVRFTLTRFSLAIRDITCKVSDESGPRGAATRRCRIVVRFLAGGNIIAEAEKAMVLAACSVASKKAERAVARHLDRKRQTIKYHRRRNFQLEPMSL